jgi:hypothetical protein
VSYGERNALENLGCFNFRLRFFCKSFPCSTASLDACLLCTRHLGCGVSCALILFHGKNQFGIGEAHIHKLDGNGRVLDGTTCTAIYHGQRSEVAVEFTFTG